MQRFDAGARLGPYERRLRPVAVLRVLSQITRAMRAARSKGVVHNGLRPVAMVVGADGRVRMTGIGISGTRLGLGALVGLTGSLAHAGDFDVAPGRRGLAWASAMIVLAITGVVTVPRLQAASVQRASEVRVVPAPAPKSSPPASELSQLPAPEPVAPAAAPAIEPLPDSIVESTKAASAAAPPGPEPEPIVVPFAEPSLPVPAAQQSARPLAVRGDRGPASLLTEASVRATEFDLAGAAELLSGGGDSDAQVASIYMRGLIDARAASRRGGSPESLAPVRTAIAALAAMAKGRPGSAEIARLVLQAAAAAAQSEREEMRLYLDTAIRMERLQRSAGLTGAPFVPAAEIAGDLWLQVHRYDEARAAYDEASLLYGSTLRTLAGQARAARGVKDAASACAASRALLDAWAARPGSPDEIVEARAYVAGSCPAQTR